MFNKIINYSTGKRKTAIARIFIQKGEGKIIINNLKISIYFKNKSSIYNSLLSLYDTELYNKFDIFINIKGGGYSGQSQAICHGIAKVLIKYLNVNKNISNTDKIKKTLKKLGYLTRDSRIVERKKFGKRKARKSIQYSKR